MASSPATEPVLARLRVLLLAMEYEDFAKCVCRLLEAIGYQDARPAGRTGWKGYNRPGGGGWDIEAALPGGLVPRRVVVQAKQFDGLTVHQRNVDELRGACLRAGASEALLVTTSAFSAVVRKAAASPSQAGGLAAPVRLIGGEELLALMVRHRIGVRRSGRGFCQKRHAHMAASEIDNLKTADVEIKDLEIKDLEIKDLEIKDLEIDEAFFRSLAGPAKPTAARCERPTLPGRSGWRVTVQVFSRPLPRPGRRESVDGQSMKGEADMKGGY